MRPALVVFFGAFLVYAASPVKVQSDTIWSIPTAVSLLDRGDTDLDEYRATIAVRGHGIVEANGHAYCNFPIGPSLVALPLLFVFDRLVGFAAPAVEGIPRLAAAAARWQSHFHAVGLVDLRYYDTIELIIASLLVSGAGVLVFLTARRQAPLSTALGVAGIFCFGTSAWSTASRLLWQHSPSVLAIAALVYLLTRPERTGRWALGLGLVAGLAFLFRPTNAITLATCAALLVRRPRLLGVYLLGAAAIAIPFGLYSLRTFGSLLPAYYLPERLAPGDGHFVEALLGNLVSPARGLWIFSPVLLLGLWGARARAAPLTAAERLFLAVPLAHWVAISSFPHWWAGDSFGPRFFTDVLPYLVYFLVSPLEAVRARPRQPLTLALGLTAALSVAIHLRGATAVATHQWNDGPPTVDQAPGRVWDWRDLQFLRGL